MAMPGHIEEKTRQIAKRRGCDMAVFHRCWSQNCRCEREARQEIDREFRERRKQDASKHAYPVNAHNG